MVSLFLFLNGIRVVKEIALMGVGLGPHTYQALSSASLISFFTEFDDALFYFLVS